MRLLASLVVLLAVSGCFTSGPLSDKVSHVGDANKDLGTPAKYTKLLVEIDHPPSDGPDPDALATFKENLQQATGRAASAITFDTSDASIPAEPSKKYTLDEIQALENAHRQHHSGGDTAVLYMIYVSGGNEADTQQGTVLGVTYRGTSIAIFKGNIRAASASGLLSSAPPLTCVEQSVVTHEFGHAAGLVNLGTPMQKPHEDADHKGHSSNKNSVMYWQVESSYGIQNLFTPITGGNCDGTGIPYRFDADDLADLAAVR